MFPSVAALLHHADLPAHADQSAGARAGRQRDPIISRAESETAYLTIDGQVGEPLERGDRVVCRRSDECVQLIRPPRMMFFDVLREKLSWGER